MKIAFVSANREPYIAPVDVEGGTIVMLNLAEQLTKRGHKVDVYTRLETDATADTTYKKIKAKRQQEVGGELTIIDENTKVYRHPFSYGSPSVSSWESALVESSSYLEAIEESLVNNDYDIIHYFHLASVVGWYKRYTKPPLIERSTFNPLLLTVGRRFQELDPDRIKMEKQIFQDMPCIIGQSEGEIEKIVTYHEIPADKIYYVPLGVDLSIFYPKKEYNEFKESIVTLLTCPNNIKPQKKQLEVLKIVKYLKDNGYPVLVTFSGNIENQEYMSGLLDYIKTNNLSYTTYAGEFSRNSLISLNVDIIFVPSQREKMLGNIIRSSDFGVFPSTDEGFCLVNINCMACGTLTVCANNKEYTYYVKPGINAVTLNTEESWESYAKEIINLIKNKDKMIMLSHKASSDAKQFTWEKTIEKQLEVYKQICQKKY